MNIKDKILELKKEKNACILAHCYQNVEIDEVADFVGDSLYLSRMAAKTDADIIVFAGVFFMAQTAKIISPNKKVLLPNMNSGCVMANMINEEQLKEFKEKHPNLPVVCYVNSTAEVKALCDICCTSANAEKIIKSLNAKEVLFVPDTHLGKWSEYKLQTTKVITYPGFCPTHLKITKQDIITARENYPESEILVHPECHIEVSKLADFVGSTSGIMNYVKESDKKSFVIGTEQGVIDRLKRDYPDKELIPVKADLVCFNMKFNTLEDIYESLLHEQHEITVEKEIADKARNCITKMLEVK
ncbi:quinolinate synthase NadA [bacterium]|nr:quinolinate synthase NadA [bacterium]